MDDNHDREPRVVADQNRGCLVDGAFLLLGLLWGLGTPYLAFGSMIAAAPFFGDQPTAAELTQAKAMLLGALACGVLAPTGGLLLAVSVRRRMAAWMCSIALAISLLAMTAFGVIAPDSLRSMRDLLGPPASTPTSTARPICQEHSGGDTRCPGG